MTSVDSGSTATYKYNALGQRVERFLTNGSYTMDYPFGLGGEELSVYSAGGAIWFGQNVPMGNRILVQYASAIVFPHANNLGTSTVATDQTGAELQDELFYPWGQDWTRTGLPYVMHFAGMHQLQDAGLYPTPNRDFTPNLGRWMSPDPLGGDVTNPQSLNRYAYVLNNPATLTDPLGLFKSACDNPTYAQAHSSCANPNPIPVCSSSDPFYSTCDPGPWWDVQYPGGRGVGGGGGDQAQSSTQPSTPTTSNACTEPILSAVNNQFDTNFTSPQNLARDPFPNGSATNLLIVGGGLLAAQFNTIQTGRYPLNWWTYLTGYGPTLHVTGRTYFDPPPAVFQNLNVGGATAVLFTAHIDTGFAYNPIGFLIHLLRDVLHLGGPRNPCPRG